MKAAVIESFGGSAPVKTKQLPLPTPTDHEVQIALEYTSVNPVDWKIREGMFKGRLPYEFPIILGWDAAGRISAVGKEVHRFKVGDAVFAYCRKPLIKWGTYAEFVCIDDHFVAFKPSNISFAEAACIPLAGLTAWQSLFDAGKLSQGETVLIHAGAGGVGSLAIQLAKNKGAFVITTASRKNHSYVKKLGADLVIDYTEENFVERIKKEFPDGIDLVFDTVGGKTCHASFDLLKTKGRIVSIREPLDPKTPQPREITGFYVFVEPNGNQLKQIADLIAQNKLTPPHIEEMALEEAEIALDKSRLGHVQGKIVLRIH